MTQHPRTQPSCSPSSEPEISPNGTCGTIEDNNAAYMRFAVLLLVYKMSKEAKYNKQTRMRSKKDQLQLDIASIQN
jgi:hypothetical protein